MGEVERIALEISNPDSTSFSQHLSFHELKALTAPHASDVAKVYKSRLFATEEM